MCGLKRRGLGFFWCPENYTYRDKTPVLELSVFSIPASLPQGGFETA